MIATQFGSILALLARAGLDRRYVSLGGACGRGENFAADAMVVGSVFLPRRTPIYELCRITLYNYNVHFSTGGGNMSQQETTSSGGWPRVVVVDDDPSVAEALSLLLRIEGLPCRVFDDGETFLETLGPVMPDCIILDLRMPGLSGLEILRRVRARDKNVPVFIISGYADIPIAVEVMKAGACDFLQKPFVASDMVERIRAAVASRAGARGRVEGVPQFAGESRLTARERDVLSQIARGASNKEAGRLLGISPRTIEVHRARIMAKLGARNAADLMRIVLSNGGARPAVPNGPARPMG
jgi:FixJ family two-component response regulator